VNQATKVSRSATEIQALKVEVEVEGEVQPSWNGVQWWCGNAVQWCWVEAKLRKKDKRGGGGYNGI